MLLLAERLAAALGRSPDFTQIGLAKACGIKPPSVSDWLNGKTKKLEGSNLLSAAEYLDVNPWWLATGKGKIDRSAADLPRPLEDQPPVPEQPGTFVDGDAIQQLISVYVNSDADGREILLKTVSILQRAIDKRRLDLTDTKYGA